MNEKTKEKIRFPLRYVSQIEEIENFDVYGVYLIRNFVRQSEIEKLKSEISAVLNGKYSTGITPDKFKIAQIAGAIEKSYSVCNGWKSSSLIREFCTDSGFGDVARKIKKWNSVKLNQDSIFTVPPKTTSTAMHQDNAYQKWHDSKDGIVTAWCAISEITEDSGGINYLLKSHKTDEPMEMIKGPFISNEDPYAPLEEKLGTNWQQQYELYQPTLNPGDVIFHHGNLWHGSTANLSSKSRMSISVHLMNGAAKYSGIDINPVFNKYRKLDTDEMDPSFFPYCV
jgi:ectoine hydroxylase-related dioxygenase (phytanoyl-CoA dioxygenase family)